MKQSLLKPAGLVLVIVAAAVFGWELFLRNKGVEIAYDDGGPLWSDKRAMVFEPSEEAVVFIGSSRIKFDLDIDTWEKSTGTKAAQLAIEGASPRPCLEDLAADPNFKGRLVVDVTEGLFFSNFPGNSSEPNKFIKYFHDRTPAQRASFVLNKWLESAFVFLDKDHFSLNANLDELQLKSRRGVFMMPIFPREFNTVTFDRQCKMTDQFLVDSSLQKQVEGIWLFFDSKPSPPMPEEELTVIFNSVKAATDKIRARGGEVFFVRTPSSGFYRERETERFPREKFWARLLAETGCKGFHYTDSPAMLAMVCPEWSHLSPADAVVFTKELIPILEREQGWKLSKN